MHSHPHISGATGDEETIRTSGDVVGTSVSANVYCVDVYACGHIFMHVSVFAHVCLFVCLFACLLACLCVCVCVCVCVCE